MFEVDYLAVGENSHSGDAVVLRFTRPDTGRPAVVVIDGGFSSNGQQFVDLIRTHYGTRVDLVVSTHPDQDHIGGLSAVLEQLIVTDLLVHRPASYGYSDDDGVSASRIEELVTVAKREGVKVLDDLFGGTELFGGAMMIAGPSKDFYLKQLAAQRALERSSASRFTKAAPRIASAVVRRVKSLFGDPGETMTGDNGGTNPRNNMSIVLDLYLRDDNKRMLFTGDAGAPALTEAADLLYAAGRDQRPIDMFHVPHHGSRHNLTPELLDRFLGPRHQPDQGIAVASVAQEADDHPRPEVANAIKRRGYPVHTTGGNNLHWRSPDAPARSGYTTSQPLGWLDESDTDTASGAA